MRSFRFNPLRPRELDQMVLLLAALVGATVVVWALQPPWQVVFVLILAVQLFGVELLRRYYRDIRREAARQRADRAG